MGVSSELREQPTKGSLSFPGENTTPNVEPMVPVNERGYFLRSTGTPSAPRKSEALTKMPSGVPLFSAGVVSSTPNILQSLESNKVSSGVEHVQNQPKYLWILKLATVYRPSLLQLHIPMHLSEHV